VVSVATRFLISWSFPSEVVAHKTCRTKIALANVSVLEEKAPVGVAYPPRSGYRSKVQLCQVLKRVEHQFDALTVQLRAGALARWKCPSLCPSFARAYALSRQASDDVPTAVVL
jgi:hypothetical protein